MCMFIYLCKIVLKVHWLNTSLLKNLKPSDPGKYIYFISVDGSMLNLMHPGD